MNISIIILAAGSSFRMGSTKQLLPYRNSTLLDIAIDNAIRSEATNVYCILGANAEAIKKKCKSKKVILVLNPNFRDGLSSSIVAGIQYVSNNNASTEAAIITLADQPKVGTTYLNKLIKKASENPETLIASDYGFNKGVPACFPKSTFPSLLKLQGDKGARDLLNDNSIKVITISSNHALLDIDTPKDYQELLKTQLL